ncbi:MAG: sel1 repeat family protein, partial [Candidatus Marinimicrobia bacterium]|nr:sel1 repeat family protein [Candidatus Neomarinimicrobiota bacterium]
GIGVKEDYERAFYWMKKAAENEHIDAQYDLSEMYFYGLGVERDSVLGNYWLEAAEENEYWWYYGW